MLMIAYAEIQIKQKKNQNPWGCRRFEWEELYENKIKQINLHSFICKMQILFN